MSAELVVGIDAGGTSTRARATTLDGTVVGVATTGGANPNSHPPSLAAERIADVAAKALDGNDPKHVSAAVLGLAGETKLVDPEVATLFDRAWRATGIPVAYTVVSDSEVAFASATAAQDGTALIAGTGSISVGIRAHRKIRIAGGFGWLLGDEGSGFWLGREVVRATLRALGSGVALTPLGERLYEEAVGDEVNATSYESRRAAMARLITAANAEPPIRLARFAPLVSEAAAAGDAVAVDILDRAVEHLSGFAVEARADDSGPVVLTGALIGPGGPLTERLRARLAERTGAEALLAKDGAAGAAWLAALLRDPDAPHPVVDG